MTKKPIMHTLRYARTGRIMSATPMTSKSEKRHTISQRGAKYTRSRLPVSIVYFEECEDKSAAMSREWHLKKLTHAQKDELVKTKH